MNKIFKVIFNRNTKQLQVVSELASSQGKVSSTGSATQSQADVAELSKVKSKTASSTDQRKKLTNTICIGMMGSGLLIGGSAIAATFTGTTPAALRNELNTILAPYCITTVAVAATHPTNQGLTVTTDATILGMGAKAYTNTSEVVRGSATAIGSNANAAGHSDVAIGSGATTYQHAYNGWSAVAIGNRSSSTNLGTVAIGENSKASDQAAMAIGVNTNATGLFSTAIASCSTASAAGSTAIGAVSNATGQYSTTIGIWANATGVEATSIGHKANANATNATAVGTQSKALSQDSIAIGTNAQAKDSGDTIAIGQNTEATGGQSIAMGKSAISNGLDAIAIGNDAIAKSVDSISIGHNVTGHDQAIGSVLLGANTAINGTAFHSNGTAIANGGKKVGGSTLVNGDLPVTVIGYNASSNSDHGDTLVGAWAKSGNNKFYTKQHTALGARATAYGDQTLAIGADTIAVGNSSIALGGDDIDAAATKIARALGVDPQGTTETNRAFLNRVTQAIASFSNDSSVTLDQEVKDFLSDNLTQAQINNGAAKYVNTASLGDASVAIGVAAQSYGTASNAIGVNAMSKGDNSVALGTLTRSSGKNAIAIGLGAQALEEGAISIGIKNIVNATNAGAIGDPSIVSGAGAYTLGNDNAIGATSPNTGAFGNNNQIGATATYDAAGKLQTASGLANPSDASGSRVVGNNNTVSTKETFVLGNKVVTTLENSVFLGSESAYTTKGASTDGNGTVSAATVNNLVYSGFAGETPVGVVSVGADGKERRIQNVAAGLISATSTDAINGSQLYVVADKLKAAMPTVVAGDNVTVVPTTEANGSITYKVSATGGSTAAPIENYLHVNDGTNTGGSTDTNLAGADKSGGATQKGAIAIGMNTKATGGAAVAIGQDANASQANSIAIGTNAKTNTSQAIAIGQDATVTGIGYAIGYNATSVDGFAFGTNASASHGSALAMGLGTIAKGVDGTNFGATAVGSGSVADGRNAAAFGEAANATGSAALSVGINSNATANNTISVGVASQATSVAAAAFGYRANATGNSSLAVGREALSSGLNSTAVGRGAISSGQGAAAFGFTANASGSNTIAIGTNSSANIAGSVALGLNATTTAATPTNTATVNGVTYSGFAGNTAAGTVVSVGKAGEERQIQNVAAGQITATSTDAINGSQLYMVTDKLANGWEIANAGGKVGDVKIGQNPSNQVKFVGEGNTKVDVTGTDGQYTVKISSTEGAADTNTHTGVVAAADGKVKVTKKAAADEGDERTYEVDLTDETKAQIAKEESVSEGDNVTVTANGTNPTGGNDFKVSLNKNLDLTNTGSVTIGGNVFNQDGLTINNGPSITRTGINAGNTTITNVANGTNATDAVNVSQLNAAKTEVEAGKQVTVTNRTGDAGQTIYTVNAKDTTASVAQGSTDYVTVTKGETNADNATDYAIGLTDKAITDFTKDENTHTGVVAAADGKVKVTKKAAADEGDERTYEVDLTDETKAQIAKEESVSEGDNVTVTANGTNPTGGNDFKVSLNKNLDLTNTGSVTIGGNVFNQDGLTINNGPSITRTGINAGNTTITNVANGTNATDAVNVSQLNAAKTEVEAGKQVTVTNRTGDAGQTIYTVNAKDTTASVAQGSTDYVTVTKGETNADNATDYAIGLTDKAITDFTKDENTHTGVVAAADGKVKVTKKAAADEGDERTYEVDLTDETKAQIAKEESVSEGDNVTVTANGTNPTGGNDFKVSLNKNLDLTNTGSVTIGGNVFNQDGLTINNGPSITRTGINAGNTTITNVANGTNATDAVNVSQLNAAKTEVEAGKQVTVTNRTGDAGQTIYTVNAKDTTASVAQGSTDYVTVTKGETNADNATDYAIGLTDKAITDFTKDENTHTGVVAAADGKVKVTKKAAADEGDERTYEVDLTDETKAQIAKEESVSEGDNVTVTANGTNPTGGNDFKVSLNKNLDLTNTGSVTIGGNVFNQDGLTINNGPSITRTGINAGNTTITNVANGTNATDAVNVSQLNAAKTEVEAGKQVTVTNRTGDAGQTIYTVNAKDTTASVAQGSTDYVTVTKGETNADNATDYAIGLTDKAITDFTKDENTHTGVVAAADGKVKVTKKAAADEGDERTYEVDLTDETKAQIAKEESVSEGDNVTVTANGTNPTGGNDFKVSLNKNLDLTNTGSVTIGGNVFNQDGLTINNGPSITRTGINAGNTTITNVANGTNATDAVNVSQLNAAKTEVEAGKQVTVTNRTGDAGQTIYTVNAKDTTASVAQGSTDYVTVTKGETNADNATDYAIGLTDKAITDFTKDENTHTGVVAAADGKVKVTKKAAADEGDERTYEVDLTDETKAQIAKEESVSEGDNVTVTANGTNPTGGNDFKVSLNKNLDLTNTGSVTIGGNVFNQDGLTINNGPSITRTGINAGNTTITNVANGTNATDAVNVSQLNAAKTEVEAGKQVTVTNRTGDAGQTIYTVNAKDTTASVAQGSTDYVTVTKGETNADNATDYAIGLTDKAITDFTKDENTHTGVVAAADGKVKVTKKAAADEGDERTYEVDLTDETKAQIAKEESVSEGDNVTVTANGTNPTGGNDFKVSLNKNLDLTNTGSVTIGGNVFNQDGLTINNGPSITRTGINAGNTTITNVANGTNATDAVNVSQLNAAKTEVTGSGLANVTNSTGANGQTIYNVDVAKADAPTVARGNVTVKTGDENKVMTAGDVAKAITDSERTSSVVAGSDALTVKAGDEDANGNTEYTVDLSADLKTQIAKEETVVAGNNNLTVTSEKTNSTGGKEFVVTLNKDIDLGNDGSVTIGGTTINNDGLTINNGPSVTNTGINAGDKKITNVQDGDISPDSKDAVNGSQLYQVAQNITNVNNTVLKGFNINADNGTEDNVQLGETVKYTSDSKNIVTTVRNNEVNFDLANEITVGKDGANGVDGKVGVTGKDGASVVLNGKDGSIGLTGPKGADGTDGKSANISVKDGAKGLDGNDGANGESKTRIVYEKQDGTTEEIATLNDGLIFSGNNEDTKNRQKLNTEVKVKGEGVDKVASENFESAEGNINVQANGSDTLEIQLNKDLNLTDKGSVKMGDTTINNDGLTINNGPSVTNTGINAGDKKITNVQDGEVNATSKDAVNGSQLYNAMQNLGWDLGVDGNLAEDNEPGEHRVTSNTKATIKGGKNIKVARKGNSVEVSTSNTPEFETVNIGGTTLSSKVANDGVNELNVAGNNGAPTRITNVAAGVKDNDAVNVSQLKGAVNNLNNRIGNVDKDLRAGVAGALAAGNLYHVTQPGKSMVSAGVGTYRGQGAIAVGYSRLSDNGKVGIKFSVNSNSRGHTGAAASVGYQW